MIPGDPACYRGTDVLVNRFDLRDAEILKAVEYKFSVARELELAVKPLDGPFNFEMLKRVHQHLFQDTYEWAGTLRQVDFAKRHKETMMVTRFTPLEHMSKKVEAFDRFLSEHNGLQGLSKAEFIPLFAQVHAKLNEIHPFREGNGRSTRVFMAALAKSAGFDFRMDKIDPDEWILASHKAQLQEDSKDAQKVIRPSLVMIQSVLSKCTEPTIDHAFAHETKNRTIALHPQSVQHYERLDSIDKKVRTLPDAQDRIRLAAAARESIQRTLKEQREASEHTMAFDRLAEVRPEVKNNGPVYASGIDLGIMCSALVESYLDQKMDAPKAYSVAQIMAMNLTKNAEMADSLNSPIRSAFRPR